MFELDLQKNEPFYKPKDLVIWNSGRGWGDENDRHFRVEGSNYDFSLGSWKYSGTILKEFNVKSKGLSFILINSGQSEEEIKNNIPEDQLISLERYQKLSKRFSEGED